MTERMCKGPHLLPISLFTVSVLTFLSTYILSVLNGHVAAFFPYISDTGTTQPESCLFGMLLNIASVLSFCTMFIRFKLVPTISEEENLDSLNTAAFVFGIISSLGLAMVANIQETAIYNLHMTGAALTLGGGIMYMLLQTWISYRLRPHNSLNVCRFRLLISLQCIGFAALFFLGAVISRSQTQANDKLHWKKEDGGYTAHIISTFSEWSACLTYLLYFLTFVKEYKHSTIEISVTHKGYSPLHTV